MKVRGQQCRAQASIISLLKLRRSRALTLASVCVSIRLPRFSLPQFSACDGQKPRSAGTMPLPRMVEHIGYDFAYFFLVIIYSTSIILLACDKANGVLLLFPASSIPAGSTAWCAYARGTRAVGPVFHSIQLTACKYFRPNLSAMACWVSPDSMRTCRNTSPSIHRRNPMNSS